MRVLSFSRKLVSSFWFIPAMMVAAVIGVFALTYHLDTVVSSDLSGVSLLFSGGPSAASDVFTAIAGSSITVIGTTFSLTIVTFTLTSGQYTPRMLKNLSSDRGLRVVLGAYLATFVYALLGLRTVRFADSSGGEFVPLVSAGVAFAFALVCIFLLVYFIYHVINLIQPSTLFDMLHSDTRRSLSLLPDAEDDSNSEVPAPDESEFHRLVSGSPDILRAGRSGYIQELRVEALVEAIRHSGANSCVELPFVVGDFVAEGMEIVRVWPSREGGLGEEVSKTVHESVVFGKERTIDQDFTFGLRQLTDISLKGLSPSTNDPTTAMQSLDRIESVLILLAAKRLPARTKVRHAHGGDVFVLAATPTFEDIAELSFDQACRAALATGQVVYLMRSLRAIERVMDENRLESRRTALWKRAFDVARLAPASLPDECDALTLTLRVIETGNRFRSKGEAVGRAIERDLAKLPDLWTEFDHRERITEAISDATARRLSPRAYGA